MSSASSCGRSPRPEHDARGKRWHSHWRSRCRSTASSPGRARRSRIRSARAGGAARVGVRRAGLARGARHGRRRGQRGLRRHRRAARPHRRHDHGPQDVQRRRGPVGGRPERQRLVGRRPAVPPPRVRAHPPPARAADASDTTFHFVTDGIESALEQARAAAGGKDVVVAGGARPASSTSPPGCSTRCRSTSRRSCSAAATRLFDDVVGRARARADDRLARRHAPALPRREVTGRGPTHRRRRSPRTRGRPSRRPARRAR